MIFVIYENNYGEEFIAYGESEKVAVMDLESRLGEDVIFAECAFFVGEPVVFERTVKSKVFGS